tara:strand:+ start:727 stop:978 length:252 start_codon:yes stop_codon:yes gene_type:complete
MAQIQPINFPFTGEATTLKVLILNFPTDANTCTTYNELLTEDNVMCANWNYTLTDEEFADWGTENTWVEQCVANNKNITILTF